MTADGRSPARRPREVTIAGFQIVVGSALVLFLAFNAMSQLQSSQMREILVDILESDEAAGLDLTLESARTLVRYSLLIAGAMAAVALVLGIFVLRRDRSSRIALTVMGALIAGVTLFAGPAAWVITVYVVASVLLLWTKAARLWFSPAPPATGPAGPPTSTWPPPPPPPDR